MHTRAGWVRDECLVLGQSIKSHGPRMGRCQFPFEAFPGGGQIKGQTLGLEALKSSFSGNDVKKRSPSLVVRT